MQSQQTRAKRHPKVAAYHQGMRWGVRTAPVMRAYADAETMLLNASVGDLDSQATVYRLIGSTQAGTECIPYLLEHVRNGEADVIIPAIDLMVASAFAEDASLRRSNWRFR